MSREKKEAWSKGDAFKFWDTADGKPVKNKTKCITVRNFRIGGNFYMLDLSEIPICLQ